MITVYEYFRKAIHLFNLVIPLSYWALFPNKNDFALIVFALTSLFILIDLLRMKSLLIKNIFTNVFGKMLRDHELKGQFTGATWVMIGSFFTILVFSKNIAIISLIFMSLGDTFAALVGRKYGKISLFNKTLEGFVGGLLPCIIASFYFDILPLHITLMGAFTAMVSEILPIPIDDNFSIPLLSGTVMTLGLGA